MWLVQIFLIEVLRATLRATLRFVTRRALVLVALRVPAAGSSLVGSFGWIFFSAIRSPPRSAGLVPGERIVVNGLQRVRPGALLAPQPVSMTARTEVQAKAAAPEKKS